MKICLSWSSSCGAGKIYEMLYCLSHFQFSHIQVFQSYGINIAICVQLEWIQLYSLCAMLLPTTLCWPREGAGCRCHVSTPNTDRSCMFHLPWCFQPLRIGVLASWTKCPILHLHCLKSLPTVCAGMACCFPSHCGSEWMFTLCQTCTPFTTMYHHSNISVKPKAMIRFPWREAVFKFIFGLFHMYSQHTHWHSMELAFPL